MCIEHDRAGLAVLRIGLGGQSSSPHSAIESVKSREVQPGAVLRELKRRLLLFQSRRRRSLFGARGMGSKSGRKEDRRLNTTQPRHRHPQKSASPLERALWTKAQMHSGYREGTLLAS